MKRGNMTESKELEKIKKIYGEDFMKLCRTLFPTILDKEGRLLEILNLTFAGNSRTLYDDIVSEELEEDFKNYIYSKVDVEDSEKRIIEEKTPYELFEEAGYDLIECTTDDEIQNFRKYYAPKEELCTFHEQRLKRCLVFFAVKKNVDDIKRENFVNPQREDEYSTSVLGIQFDKRGKCIVSIKSRYNHTINNPDAVYGNDLDRIIPGLTQSFTRLLKERGLELDSSNKAQFEMPDYIIANDGKYYKYNNMYSDVYYCPGNIIIIDGEPKRLNPDKQILIDDFIIDLENKTVTTCTGRKDSFLDDFENIKKIEIQKSTKKGHGARKIIIEKDKSTQPIIIEIDEDNNIIGYINPTITHIGDDFLATNIKLRKIELPNVTHIGDKFLYDNDALEDLFLEKLIQAGNSFMYRNEILSQIHVPELISVEDCFLNFNSGLVEFNAPNLSQVGDAFLCYNENIRELVVPKLKILGDRFMRANQGLNSLSMPSLERVGEHFLRGNINLSQLVVPNLQVIGNNFLKNNKALQELILPEVVTIGFSFVSSNKILSKFEAPKLSQVGFDFFNSNEGLTSLSLPNLTHAGNPFLCSNKNLIKLEIPHMPTLEEQFSYMIKRNLEARKNQNISIASQDISKLYSDTDLTISEIDRAKKELDKFLEQEKNR